MGHSRVAVLCPEVVEVVGNVLKYHFFAVVVFVVNFCLFKTYNIDNKEFKSKKTQAQFIKKYKR